MPQPSLFVLQEPDLYYAINMYEERLKTALQFNLQLDQPSQYIVDFFTNTFAPDVLGDQSRPEAKWYAET